MATMVASHQESDNGFMFPSLIIIDTNRRHPKRFLHKVFFSNEAALYPTWVKSDQSHLNHPDGWFECMVDGWTTATKL